jgi:hypothetical protein
MYAMGIKLLPREVENISVIYLCDYQAKEVEVINCFQFDNIRTIGLVDIEPYADIFFSIDYKTFYRIRDDYNAKINFDLSLNNFLLYYNLDEWAI